MASYFIYKSPKVPNREFINQLAKVYDNLINKGKEILLLGDLNIDMSCEDNLVKNELCDMYDLYNIISEPTCFKRLEGTLINPIIVRSKERFKKSINVFCGYSDHHNLVGCITKLQVPIKKPMKITYSSLKHFNKNIFKREVSMIPFHISNIFSDVGDQYWVQKYLFMSGLILCLV